MALFNRAGNILRQTLSKQIDNEMFQMKQCMSYKTVRVGGLASATNDASLREAFTAYGEVTKARVITDKETGKSRGFGFVSFADYSSPLHAITAMDQWELDGETVSVRMDGSNTLPDHIQYECETEPYGLIHQVKRTSSTHMWRSTVLSRQVLGPGMVLFKNFLSLHAQVDIVNICEKCLVGPGGFYQPCNPSGAELGPRMMCFGRNWDPVTKYKKRYRSDGSQPPPLPYHLGTLAKYAVKEAERHVDEFPPMSPDICLVNFYSTSSRLGLHQDHDESSNSLSKGLPVVSISIGDSAEFLYGHTTDETKLNKVLLESGDVLVFGGESRHIFHGVNRILPHSSPGQLSQATGLRPGRLNLTLKQI